MFRVSEMVSLFIYINYVLDWLIKLAVATLPWTAICVTISICVAVCSVWSIDGQNAVTGCGSGGRMPASRRPMGNYARGGQLAGAAGTGLWHPTMVIMATWDQKPGVVRRLPHGDGHRLLGCSPPFSVTTRRTTSWIPADLFLDHGATTTMPKVAVLCRCHFWRRRSHPKAGMVVDHGATAAKNVTDHRGNGVCARVCVPVHVCMWLFSSACCTIC